MPDPTAGTPRTEAGRRVLPWHAASHFNRGGLLPAEAHERATADIRAIEAEASGLDVDYEAMRMDRGWPTPDHMRRAAEALDTFTPARYGDVLRWFADLADASLASRLTPPSETEEPVEYGFCGSLGWTVKEWGRITHKHSCPNRTDPWCQTHPSVCPPSETEP